MLEINTIYGMVKREKPTFAPGWWNQGSPVEFCVKVKVVNVEVRSNGDQYFTWVPAGFSSGLCGFGGCLLSHIVSMQELGPAPKVSYAPIPSFKGNPSFDPLM